MLRRLKKLKSEFQDVIFVFRFHSEKSDTKASSISSTLAKFSELTFTNKSHLMTLLKRKETTLNDSDLLTRLIFNFSVFLIKEVK